MFGFSLMALAIGFGTGLGIGWFVLKRPQWAEDIYARVAGWLS